MTRTTFEEAWGFFVRRREDDHRQATREPRTRFGAVLFLPAGTTCLSKRDWASGRKNTAQCLLLYSSTWLSDDRPLAALRPRRSS